MKSLKIKIPGLLGAIMILFVSAGIEENIVKYCLCFVSAIMGLSLAYLITNDITELVLNSKENRRNEIDRLAIELNESIAKYSNEQNENAKTLMRLVEQFNKATEQYMERLDSFTGIQNTLIGEGKKLVGEVQSLNCDIYNILEEFCSKIDNRLSSTIWSINSFNQKEEELITDAIASVCKQNEKHEENIEKIIRVGIDEASENAVNAGKTIGDILEDFCSDFSELQIRANEHEAKTLLSFKASISEYMTKYEVILSEARDSLNALKAQVKVSMEQTNKAIETQTLSIEDGLENCTDEIGERLGTFSKEQKTRDDEQNTKLNEGIKAIESAVTSQIEQVLEENEKLIKYIQKVQEEWTTLSKDEIAFLDKVWNE